jgi:hypothetical protein
MNAPTTDQEVASLMLRYRDQTIRSALQCIYKARRGMGDTVLDAWIYTLRCHVDPKHPSLTPLK